MVPSLSTSFERHLIESVVTVLPTSRAIRHEILKHRDCDGFLPSYMTMSELLQRLLSVKGYRRVDDDTRTMLLLEASDFSNFSTLQIERNFFTFTQNSSYIFRFFEELRGELIEIDSLDHADTYGDYEEHIAILRELFNRYRSVCESKSVFDPIFVSESYRLNRDYVSSLGKLKVVVEGYLTDFEIRILRECAEIIPVELLFYASPYNQKMQNKLAELGSVIEEGKQHIIDVGLMRSLSHITIASNTNIECKAFGERILQVAYIKQKVYEYVQSGIPVGKIAVVLPDESFAQYLKLFDGEYNYNFAMGVSLEESTLVQRLHAVCEWIDNPTVQNTQRLERLGNTLAEEIAANYYARMNTVNFELLMQPFMELETNRAVKEIAEEELYRFGKLDTILNDMNLKSALHLFINRLKARSIDDVRGGQITVMGVLETRSVSYEGVIVVDFNEGKVPRRSEKDLFLNSNTRQKAGLPSAADREGLQKHYYHMLFMRAKRVSIAYVESSEAVASRFLTQLKLPLTKEIGDDAYAHVLMESVTHKAPEEEPIEADYDFTAKALSSTGLSTFLRCRRKFYHRYVESLEAHELPRDLPQEWEIGNDLHNALKSVYETRNSYDEKEELRRDIEKALEVCSGSSVLEGYLLKLWNKRLEPFYMNEIDRFAEGAKVLYCEKELKRSVDGMTLSGRIDRIDERNERLEVLDYKSGSFTTYTARTVENAVDFQLEFYYLLTAQLGDVAMCGFYDLNTGKVVPETLLERKLELLKDHLAYLRSNKRFTFEKTDQLGECRFCEFIHLCGRE